MQAGDYVEIGKYLRDVRENMNVTVEQAAQALHIRAKYIAKLEAGDMNDMPPIVYLRGYVKNYAEFLNIDQGKVLTEYERLFGGDTRKFFVPENNRNRSQPSRNTLWFCAAGIIFIYGYWYFSDTDHTSIKNLIPQVPAHYNAELSVMDEHWKLCLNDYTDACFMELHYHNNVLRPLIESPEMRKTQANKKVTKSLQDSESEE